MTQRSATAFLFGLLCCWAGAQNVTSTRNATFSSTPLSTAPTTPIDDGVRLSHLSCTLGAFLQGDDPLGPVVDLPVEAAERYPLQCTVTASHRQWQSFTFKGPQTTTNFTLVTGETDRYTATLYLPGLEADSALVCNVLLVVSDTASTAYTIRVLAYPDIPTDQAQKDVQMPISLTTPKADTPTDACVDNKCAWVESLLADVSAAVGLPVAQLSVDSLLVNGETVDKATVDNTNNNVVVQLVISYADDQSVSPLYAAHTLQYRLQSNEGDDFQDTQLLQYANPQQSPSVSFYDGGSSDFKWWIIVVTVGGAALVIVMSWCIVLHRRRQQEEAQQMMVYKMGQGAEMGYNANEPYD